MHNNGLLALPDDLQKLSIGNLINGALVIKQNVVTADHPFYLILDKNVFSLVHVFLFFLNVGMNLLILLHFIWALP
jgi:hypothetical protein